MKYTDTAGNVDFVVDITPTTIRFSMHYAAEDGWVGMTIVEATYDNAWRYTTAFQFDDWGTTMAELQGEAKAFIDKVYANLDEKALFEEAFPFVLDALPTRDRAAKIVEQLVRGRNSEFLRGRWNHLPERARLNVIKRLAARPDIWANIKKRLMLRAKLEIPNDVLEMVGLGIGTFYDFTQTQSRER